ncbi:ribonuclease HII [Veillonella montpellierensis DNF00314]|uniref:Ribonuclease HII n=1 Tax=Veillonella montpellierensis DNF00314 TaxID=1401067 RepID=A0A096AN62_9FIRM|nr:ribonuclease HII [Veillonella montpellierensis]KGF48126.1 ribonuclease HII [Veillonella montpellierensis DNF00314]
MLKTEFEKLTVSSIKELLVDEVALDYLLWAQEDRRSSVRQLAQSYINKQKKLVKERQRIDGMYAFEEVFYNQGMYHVAGVDEVGRGPIAGPVTVAAVILPPHTCILGLNDSKKLSEQKREALYEEIQEKAIAISCVSYGPEIIDSLNIYEATRKAMYEAVSTLSVAPEVVLVDAMKLPNLTMPVESIIKGDSKSATIAAASIIAKVTRDRYMKSLEVEYPGYGFSIHKGYYTELHREALENQGVTPIHRRSFEPIKTLTGFAK